MAGDERAERTLEEDDGTAEDTESTDVDEAVGESVSESEEDDGEPV